VETTPVLAPAPPEGNAAQAPAPEVPLPPNPDAVPAPTAVSLAGPLRPGDVLAERYEIVELLESTPEHNRYRASERGRCAACGYDDNAPGEAFCAKCGAGLDKPGTVIIEEELRRAPEQFDLRFSVDERDYFVTIEPPAPLAPEAPPAPGTLPLRLTWGRSTDQGKQRDHNEDYVEVWLYARGSGGVLGLFVVADGLGGQDSGEVASRLATDTVWEALRVSVWEPIIRGEVLPADKPEAALVAAVNAANKAVYETRTARKSEMSTTLTLALVLDGTAYIANVGDSRTYLWNAAGLRRITKDHSLVQRLVDTGVIAPRDVYTHPQRNLIYQSIGDRLDVKVDTFRHPLAADDRLILCSDGLWEMVRDEGLEEVLLAEADPQRASVQLVHNANLAGGEDNISAIIVQAIRA
jgi:serine/threonine protein phosphatase PrpC